MKLYEHFIGHKSGREGELKVRELIADGTLKIGTVLVNADGDKTIIEDMHEHAIYIRIYVGKNSANVKNKQLSVKNSFMQWDVIDLFGRRIQERKLDIYIE